MTEKWKQSIYCEFIHSTYQQFYDIKIFSYTYKIDNENIEICEQVIEMSKDLNILKSMTNTYKEIVLLKYTVIMPWAYD